MFQHRAKLAELADENIDRNRSVRSKPPCFTQPQEFEPRIVRSDVGQDIDGQKLIIAVLNDSKILFIEHSPIRKKRITFQKVGNSLIDCGWSFYSHNEYLY